MLDWLKLVPDDVAHRWQKNPFLGRSPPFDWKQLSEKLRVEPGFSDIEVQPADLQWSEDVLRELPKECATAQIALSGLQGRVFCLLPLEQADHLFNHLIGDESLAEIPLKEAFLRYFLSQALEIVGSISPLHSFVTTLNAIEEDISQVRCESAHLFVDLTAKYQERAVTMRLIFDDAFAQAWKGHWAAQNGPLLSDLISSNVELPLHFHAGQTELTIDEVKGLQVGDWIKLDSHGFDASLKPSQLTLSIGEQRVGKGLLESDQIKVQEFSSPLVCNTQKPS